jgi:phosphatidylethanolamine-binding protein (PEBP) family uncharacterized protein
MARAEAFLDLNTRRHRYVFIVRAQKTNKLELASDTAAALVGSMIKANALGKASFITQYGPREAK